MNKPRFHLAFPVKDIEETTKFYKEILGCTTGRTAEKWADFNFYGHQLSAHLKPEELQDAKTNPVDGENVPVRHFGVILEWEEWQKLSENLKGKVDFIIEPTVRFAGKIGEQATMFFTDPSGNALEIKAFRNDDQIFAA